MLSWLLVCAMFPPTATDTVLVPYNPGPTEASVPALFRLEPAAFTVTARPLLRAEAYTVEAVRFPSPVVTPDPENNLVYAEYFRPQVGGRRPAVVVLHILGADFALSRFYAARLAEKGVAALFLQLPYYGERRGPGRERRFLSADVERSVLAMRQGVCDVRRAAAWLATRPEIDPARLGATGISLGGIVASVAVAIDPTMTRGAFLLAGGDLSRILWEMPEGKRYRAAWLAAGKSFDDLKALTLPFDPLTYAEGLKGKRVFLMAGNTDEVIPPASARALWHAAGQPPIAWYDCGHYSAVGYLLPALRQATDWLAADADP